MNSQPRQSTPASPAPADLAATYDPMIRGTILGLISALAYTAANIALRNLSGTDGLVWACWVAGVKAIPCFVLSVVLVSFRWMTGKQAFPPRHTVLMLFAAAIMMQYGGNACFNWALNKVGLILTVPIVFSTLISGSAILGRLFLGEPINARTLASMGLLLMSIICLSLAADGTFPDASAFTIGTGMLLAGTSGMSYGANSIVIRRFLGGQYSVSSILLIMSTSGIVLLGVPAFFMMGTERIGEITWSQWNSMFWAGVSNAIAFYAVSSALKYIPAVRANLLNASQTAMCALAGILIFNERMTPLTAVGIGLTIAGLTLLGARRKKTLRRELETQTEISPEEATSIRE
ncbi:MAG: DMT family transporter [Planctomycetaceae bacterium]|nr:DMT family transporter [Planctomycetaceae bacterium]